MTPEIKSTNEIIHIGLEFPDDMPDVVIDCITDDLKTPGLVFKVHKHPKTMMLAALEWVIPTAFAAYLLKSYFDGFLKEAGKDHYNILKLWLKKFVDDARAIKNHTIFAGQSTQKRIEYDNQSKAVSLLIQTKNGKTIKLLFDEDLTKEDWDNAIDQFFEFIIDNYEKYPNDKLSQVLNGLDEDTRLRVYAIIDKKSKLLLFYDDKGVVQLHRK